MASGQYFPDSSIVIDATTNAAEIRGIFSGFQVFTPAAIAAITPCLGVEGVTKLIGVTLQPGFYQMRFTSIRLSVGIVMLFGETSLMPSPILPSGNAGFQASSATVGAIASTATFSTSSSAQSFSGSSATVTAVPSTATFSTTGSGSWILPVLAGQGIF